MKETKRDIDQLITPLYVAVSNESKNNTVRLAGSAHS